MVWIKKARAGSDSFGHQWPEDGSVVEVTPDEAAALLRIPDGGFSEAPAPEQPEDKPEISEAPAPRRGRPPKAKPDAAVVEE